MLSAVKNRVRKTTHKLGIELPQLMEHAKQLDKQNGDTPWQDALALEMTNVGIAFEVLEEGQKPPVSWKKQSGHLAWDVKMDFTRKARWVPDGHKTPDIVASTHAGVASRESA